jgi:hypothetical protein
MKARLTFDDPKEMTNNKTKNLCKVFFSPMGYRENKNKLLPLRAR